MDERIGPEQAVRAANSTPERRRRRAPLNAAEAMAITWAGYFASPDKVLPMPPFRFSSRCNDATFESSSSTSRPRRSSGGSARYICRRCLSWVPTVRSDHGTTSPRRRSCLTHLPHREHGAHGLDGAGPAPSAAPSTTSPWQKNSRAFGGHSRTLAQAARIHPCIGNSSKKSHSLGGCAAGPGSIGTRDRPPRQRAARSRARGTARDSAQGRFATHQPSRAIPQPGTSAVRRDAVVVEDA